MAYTAPVRTIVDKEHSDVVVRQSDKSKKRFILEITPKSDCLEIAGEMLPIEKKIILAQKMMGG